MKRALLVVTLLATRAYGDDTAALAYRQAEDLAQKGKWAEACPLYDASYHADPQIGVLLHLADCHERIGRFASAWAEFNDAVELAHRRGDNREALAQGRANALKPKLARLHIDPPPAAPPGLVVRRDGLEVTVLIGTDMPIDPGDHEIVATAPGYLELRKQISIPALATTTQLALPPLEKEIVKPVVAEPPKVHEGTLHVASEPGARLSLDGQDIGGSGRFEGRVKSGGHQLRVTAPGMRSFQSEIFISDDEVRTIDVPLEKEPVAVVAAPSVSRAPAEDLPSFEVGLAFAPGVKGHGDDPAVIAYRLDAGLRLGRRVNLGAFVEYASVSTADRCGTDILGSMSVTPFDYGLRYRFDSCGYVMAGLQVYVHILPRRRVDPYFGIAPGFRFGFVDTTPFDGTGTAIGSRQSTFMPGIALGARAGADVHPSPKLPGWAVGGFVEEQTMIIGDENFDNTNGKGKTYISFFGGLRSSWAF
jgi:hypothetical protein